jgi:hypothetical protein
MDRKRLLRVGNSSKWYLPIAAFLALVVITSWIWTMIVLPSKWRDNLPYTISLVGDDSIAVLHLDVTKKKALVVKLPPDMLVPVVNTSANYRASALWKYGEVEKKPGQIIERSLELFLGITSQGFVKLDNLPKDNKGEVAKMVIANGRISNIPLLDKIKAAWFINSLREDQFQTITLPETIGDMEELPDGSRVVSVAGDRTIPIIGKAYANDVVLSDGRRVDVINSSGETGMGIVAERRLAVSGALVADLKNGDTKDFYCMVSAPKFESSMDGLVYWMSERLGCVKGELHDGNEVELTLGTQWGNAYKRKPLN